MTRSSHNIARLFRHIGLDVADFTKDMNDVDREKALSALGTCIAAAIHIAEKLERDLAAGIEPDIVKQLLDETKDKGV